MKIVLTSGYTFTASTKTLDFSGTSGFDVKRLVAVVNLTRNAIVYAPGVSGYASISGGNVLTLSYDTTSHSNTDTLMVLYDANNLPAALGQTTKANSLAVTPPSDYQQPVLQTTSFVSGSASANNTDLVSQDVSGYSMALVQFTGTWSATVALQVSNDNSTWVTVNNQNSLPGTGGTITSNGMFIVPLMGRYFRLRTAAYSSGTISATVQLISQPLPYLTSIVTGNQGVADATTSANNLFAASLGFGFNGNTWDRWRNSASLQVLASNARTATTDSNDQTNYNWRGLVLIVNISSAGTGSITPSVQIKDPISLNYKTIWTAATPLTANGTYVYALYAGELSMASFTEVAQILLSRVWRIEVVHNNANSITYSVTADMQM